MRDPIRVLHVEDDPDFAEVTANFIEDSYDHMQVDTVYSGQAALEHLVESRYDCVVADYDLQGMNGVELLESVRLEHEELPFILFTGKGGEEVASEAINAGVTDYLQKIGGTDQIELLRNRIENAVAKHRAQMNYRTLFEQLDSGIVVHDPESGEILQANDTFGEFLGYDPEEIEHQHIGDFTPSYPNFNQERASALIQQAQQEGPISTEWPLTQQDGSERWVEVKLTPTTMDGYDRVLAVVEDITERKSREDAIRNLHEVATELAASTTREDVYRKTLEAAKTLLDFDRAAIAIETDGMLEVVAMSAAMPLDDRPTMETDEGIAGRTYQTGQSYLIDDVSSEPDAVPQTDIVSAISVPIGDRGVFQVIEDDLGAFSERDRELAELLVRHTESALDLLDREAELSRKNDRLEEFVSFVSHDLRGPLNVAVGRLELIKSEHESEHFESIESALERMDNLIDALLTLAREGDTIDDPEWVKVHELVNNCFIEVSAPEATLEDVPKFRIRADRGQLRQLIDNVLRNAIDHGGSDVTISVGILEGDAGFYIADDGPGIPEDSLEKVFDRGFSTSDEGLGYGLKIVEQIASAHDWTVSATESEHGGAQFEFSDVSLERFHPSRSSTD